MLLSVSVPEWFVKQFDCHWLKFQGVYYSQIGNKNSCVTDEAQCIEFDF